MEYIKFIEISIFILFSLCLPLIIYDKYKLRIVLLSVIYAAIFENLNIMFSEGQVGGYYYNTEFLLFILDTPLFVILSWSLIILSGMLISDNLKIKEKFKPFSDAIFVLLIDLSVDAVAIRHKLWFWNEYSLTEGFFGVPANNFIGWLLVGFTFSLFFRKINNSRYKNKYLLLIIVPIISYITFLFLFYFVELIESILNLNKSSQLFIVLFLLIIFAKIGLNGLRFGIQEHKDYFLISLIRIPFNLYAFLGLITLKVYNQAPFLFLVALFVLVIDAAAYFISKQKYYKV